MTPEEHVWFKALAFTPPNRQVLYATLEGTFHLECWPWDSLSKEILTPEIHWLFRALALGLPDKGSYTIRDFQ